VSKDLYKITELWQYTQIIFELRRKLQSESTVCQPDSYFKKLFED